MLESTTKCSHKNKEIYHWNIEGRGCGKEKLVELYPAACRSKVKQ